ncbi:MAG: VWA domain-containing protein [Patescibacteria group bacterium]
MSNNHKTKAILSSIVSLAMILSSLGPLPQVARAAISDPLAPNGIGNYDLWTANTGTKVNAVATNDGDASYIDASNNNDRQSFTVANAGIPTNSIINSVTLNAVAKYSGGSTRIQLLVENGTGINNRKTDSSHALSSSYTAYTRAMTINPFTGIAWTVAEVNAWTVRFGVVKSNSSNSARVTQLSVTVDYTITTPPTPNPSLTQSCGLDVALVADVSGSIDASEMIQLKGALTTFANAFTGTPTVFSLTTFSTTATVLNNFSRTPTQAVADIADLPSAGSNYTNWDDGLAKAYGTFDPRPAKQNLIVIATDGNPNRIGTSGTTVNEVTAVATAVTRANAIKDAGTRIIGIGIGTDLDVANIVAITGTNVAPPAAIDETVDVATADFSTLGTVMSNLAKSLCGGKILVQKQLDTNNDGQAELTGSTADSRLAGYTFDVSGSPSDPTPQTTTDTGSLEFSDVLNGSYSLTETNLVPDTTLATASCINGSLPVGSFDLGSKTVSGLTMGTDDTILCTFTNTYVPPLVENTLELCSDTLDNDDDTLVDLDDSDCAQFMPSLTVTKVVVNDNGGTKQISDFNLYIDDDQVTSGSAENLMPGSYIVSEDNLTGYTSAITNDCDSAGNVTLAINEHKSCTITNDDIAPSLTLVKEVTNNNGGEAVASAWTLSADGPTSISGAGGVVSDPSFMVGTYTLSETGGPDGYTPSDWVCTGDGAQNGNTITLGLGEAATCAITNDDQPGNITLIKQVTNDNGGTLEPDDFGLFVDDVNVMSGISTIVNAGSHLIGELIKPGYLFTGISGNGCPENLEEGDGKLFGSLFVGLGQSVTCTLTNNDQAATLIVTKEVFNQEGGSLTAGPADFTITVTGTNASPSSFAGSETGTTVTLDAGQYSVSEDGPEGYDNTSMSAGCSGTIAVGATKECLVVNTSYEVTMGRIIVDKVTDPEADQQYFNFGLTGDGFNDSFALSDTSDPYNSGFIEPGTYALSEEVPESWQLDNIICNAGDYFYDYNSISIAAGKTVICTATNTKLGKIIVAKVTDPAGSQQSFDFTTNYSDLFSLLDGEQNESVYLIPGIYSVSESVPEGWLSPSIVCSDGSNPSEIALAAGETVTCTFTNTQLGTINIQKVTSPEQTEQMFDFTVSYEPGSFSLGSGGGYESNYLEPGIYTASEESVESWVLSDISCVDPDQGTTTEDNTATIDLDAGEYIFCTFTNTYVPPEVTTGDLEICKYYDNETLGQYEEGLDTPLAWSMTVDALTGEAEGQQWITGTNGETGCVTLVGLPFGDYQVTEDSREGWIRTYPAESNSQIVTHNIQNTLVYFLNYEKPVEPTSSIHGYKWNDEDADGNKAPEESMLSGWRIFIDENENSVFDGEEVSMLTSDSQEHFGWYWFDNLPVGTYRICEVVQSGWEQTYPAGCHTVILPDSNLHIFTVSINAVLGPEYNFGNQQIQQEPTDVCPNLDGVQTEVLSGYELVEGQCRVKSSGDGEVVLTGGGGGGSAGLYIHTEQVGDIDTGSATINWFTNLTATSRVVYDIISHPIVGFLPNLGYSFSTTEDLTQGTYHVMVVSGLTPNTTYYFRPISANVANTVSGVELMVKTGEVAGAYTEEGSSSSSESTTGTTTIGDTGSGSQGSDQGGMVLGEQTGDLAQGEPELITEPEPELINEQADTTPEVITPEPEPVNCNSTIWIFIILNLIAATLLWNKEKNSQVAWKKFLWLVSLILTIVPAMIWYGNCTLWTWLLVVLILSLLFLLPSGGKKEPAPQA